MKLLKPENLDIESIVNKNSHCTYITYTDGKKGLAFKRSLIYKKLIPCIYYFVNQIILTDETNNINMKGYKRIKASDVENVMCYNKMRQVIHFLLLYKIIEVKSFTDTVQVNGNTFPINARYFKLQPDYNNGYNIIIDVDIKTKQHKLLNKKAKQMLKTDEMIQHQYNLCSNYSFDLNTAERYINDLYYNSSISNKDLVMYYGYLQMIKNYDIVFTVSEKTDRITTLINIFPKVLRRFFLDNPIELDFQTFNVNVLVKLIDENISISNISNALLNEENKITEETNSDFYKNVVKYFQNNGVTIDRDTAKDIVLWRWINKRPDTIITPEYRIMSHKYPEITKIMEQLKGKNYYEYKNYTYKFMQLESKLINEIIYKEFIRISPTAKIYTIYDSIMVEDKDKDILKHIMRMKSKEFFNREINIKEKPLKNEV